MRFPNQEYKMVYRRGTFLDKEALRREHESAPIVALSVMAGLIIILLAISVPSCAQAEEYTDEQIVQAIYYAEGGAKAQYPYGIRSVKCSTSASCRKICSTTVKNNRKRFADYGYKNSPDFITFLAARYCPIGADNDPKGLNKHWLKNVKFYLAKRK